MKLSYLCGAWVLGIALSLRWPIPLLIPVSGMVACLAYLILAFVKGWNRWWAIGLAVFLLGTIRPAMEVGDQPTFLLDDVRSGTAVEIEGQIRSFPEARGRNIQFEVTVQKLSKEGRWENADATLLVRTRAATDEPSSFFGYGDIIRLKGRLTEPPILGGFDYRQFLASRGISHLAQYPQIELLEKGKGFKPLEWIYALRERLAQGIQLALPEPQAALNQAMIVGLRADIPQEINQSLARSGTTHIMAISGLNIAMVMGLVMAWIEGTWGRRYNLHLLLALGAIWMYTLVSGAAPPAARAAIMGTFYLSALLVGRSNSAHNGLLLAAALMVGLDPFILKDVSFQLSFAAMAGLVFIAPRLSINADPEVQGPALSGSLPYSLQRFLSSSLVTTVAATIATYPITAFYFHRVSLVGIPATALALPSLPPLLTLGFLSGVAGILAPAVAPLVAWPSWLVSSYLLSVADLFSRLPIASLDLGDIGEPAVWGYYFLLLVILLLTSRTWGPSLARWGISWGDGGTLTSHKAFRWSFLAMGTLGIFAWGVVLTLPDDKLRVFFLDVGQGDAILIQAPTGKQVLIDGGPDPRVILNRLSEHLPFWDRSLDMVVLSHPHEDHSAGLLAILSSYSVGSAMESPMGSASTSYRQWKRLIDLKGIELTIARAGQVIPLGAGARLDVISPPSPPWEGTSSDIDTNGVVMRLVYGETSVLFMADVSQDGEVFLLGQEPELRSTVLKVGHHGSGFATSQPFLDKVRPDVAIVSVGAGNPFGHPSPEVVERLSDRVGSQNLLLTKDHGSIEVITNGKRLWIKTKKPSTKR